MDLYTWSNKHELDPYTKERLNHAVENSYWVEAFNSVSVESSVSQSSNHKPLLLSCGNLNNFTRKKERFAGTWIMNVALW